MTFSDADRATAEAVKDRIDCGADGVSWDATQVIAQAIADERERIGGWLALLGLDINEVVVPKEKQS